MNSSSVSRWSNPAALRQDHDIALALIKQQGVVFADDPKAHAAVQEIFSKIFLALPDVIYHSCLALLYVYEMSQQPPIISGCDGYCNISEHFPDGRQVASIEISVEALQRGPGYAALVGLHELAHITLGARFVKGEHGGLFHLWLDYLLLEYNRYHGTHIKNDYFRSSEEIRSWEN